MARKKAAKPESLFNKLVYAALAIGLLLALNLVFTLVALATGNFNPNSSGAQSLLDILSSLAFPLTAIIYMMIRKKSGKEMVEQLGLSKKGLNLTSLKYGLALFAALFLLEIGVDIFSNATGISLPTNVNVLLCGAPAYLLIFSAVGAPIDEEIFFRGFMVPRLGIVASALIFGLLHYLSYASISEFIAAFVFGLLAGYVFKKLNSIYPTIFAHMGVNAFTIVALLLTGGLCQT